MYTEVVLECDRSVAEALSDILVELGALAASIEDADAGTEQEQALYGEPGSEPNEKAWTRSLIVTLFAQDAKAQDIIAEAESLLGLSEPLTQVHRLVADQDWVRLTQSQFEPIEISPRIYIVPSWHATPKSASADAVLIELDPGLAFGTGSHATTRLCLEWLDQHLIADRFVIDYGCGSGILAIAAARLGAARVVATDIDAQALSATRSNALKNAVDVEVYAATGLPPMQADIVLANILSNPLKLLAPLLAQRVAANGWLIVSGVLERQIDEVCAVYDKVLALDVWKTHEGWACLAGRAKK